MLVTLHILNAGEKDACVGRDRAAGLDHEGEVAAREATAHGLHQLGWKRWLLTIVGHAESAAHVEMLEHDALGGQGIYHR